MPNPNRPIPPETFQGEQLLEWHRICDELERVGTLEPKLRAVIILYCQSWAITQETNKWVVQLGSVIRHFEGSAPGPSPFYKVWQQESKTCAALMAQLGLRVEKVVEQQESDELEI
jgi:P27 family predicted phage terminase small subunit